MNAEEMLEIHFSGLNGGNFSLSVPSGILGSELLHAVRLSLARS